MKPPQYILLFGDSLYLESIGASLESFQGLRLLPPGSSLPPDIILIAETDNELSLALEALRRYPQASVLAVNIETHCLTMLHAAVGLAQTPQDLVNAIAHLTGEAFTSLPDPVEHKAERQ
jgi:hypothetical protein